MQQHRRIAFRARRLSEKRSVRRVVCRGFTLTEMIISVALVLVLMLAITRIFSITSTTIGASQGFAAATRDARSAQAVMAHDVSSLASDSPFIYIRQDLPIAAFRNAQDAASDRDANAATQDFDGDNTVGNTPGEQPGLFTTDTRTHRLDRLSFCARDRFYRQTGNDGTTLVANMNSPEAWISYGHVTLPRPDGNFLLAGSAGTGAPTPNKVVNRTDPGVGNAETNPLNCYASQWVLGRVAMLMVKPGPNPNTGRTPANGIFDTDDVSQTYVIPFGSSAGQTAYSPRGNDSWTLSDAAASQAGKDSAAKYLYSSRYDLFGSNIADTTSNLQNVISGETAASIHWYERMLNYRFQVNPFATKPISAASAAQSVPSFVPACSQFIVEYAGDFITQRPDGTLNDGSQANDALVTNGGLEPDGQIDFHYDPATGSRKIQWYGMPRSVSGATTVDAGKGDTVPLGAFVHYVSGNAYRQVGRTAKTSIYTTSSTLQTKAPTGVNPAQLPNPDFARFEQYVKYTGATGTPEVQTHTFPASDVYPAAPAVASYFDTYYAAFDPATINNPKQPRPKMIRITMTIDRPELAGRTSGGQAFEYVFNLQ